MSRPIRQATGRFRQERLQILDPASAETDLATHARALALLKAWHKWRGERPIPERADVDPIDIPALLEHILLLEVEDGDFRFRLVGETIASRYAVRMKGRSICELMGGTSLDETLYEHRRCAEDRCAVLITNTEAMTSLGDIRSYTRLLLPLGGTGRRADHIIGVMQFYR
ncbi:PAS domain-containing protein [Thalassobaculum litoreum]|uniref:PAS domain-containing protein n=1 Tax=Thalassobaculum litoreum DSM 18839 TaxID=1123362 RepID=A0A8G2BM51_9PROT|nr:PAS domain-containing protein [Thalassobaculum litoreum]SDG49710.1 hypothetical protein SAMN05660686_04606 [Thalassobaculum litoreum DSM 18839]